MLAILGAVAAGATDWWYRSLIAVAGVNNPPAGYWSRVSFVTLFIAAVAAAALGGALLLALGRDRAGRPFLTAASTGAAALGVLAIFSIGVALLLVAALLVIPAARSSPSSKRWQWAALGIPIVLSLGALTAGINLTGGL